MSENYLIPYLSAIKTKVGMKSPRINLIVLFLILSLHFERSQAQDFIVTTIGDTLRGEVKPIFYGIEKKVQLRGSGKDKTIYPMFKILSFRYRDEIYQPVKGPDGYTFMKLVKPGFLSLYRFQLANQSTFDGLYLARKDGTGLEVPNLSFKKLIKKYLEDCPSVVEKIDNGDLGKKELDQIIDEYNTCMSSKSIDHGKRIAELQEQKKIISAWDILEEKVKGQKDFEGKSDALEMIQEIKKKIGSSDKIPNFLIDGLKSSLSQDSFQAELENALKEIN